MSTFKKIIQDSSKESLFTINILKKTCTWLVLSTLYSFFEKTQCLSDLVLTLTLFFNMFIKVCWNQDLFNFMCIPILTVAKVKRWLSEIVYIHLLTPCEYYKISFYLVVSLWYSVEPFRRKYSRHVLQCTPGLQISHFDTFVRLYILLTPTRIFLIL